MWPLIAIALAEEATLLDRLVERAWDREPRRVALELELAARSTERIVPREPLFRVAVRDIGSRTRRPTTTLRLRQPLEPPGALRAARRAAEARAHAERDELEQLRLELRADLQDMLDQARSTREELDLLRAVASNLEERVAVLRQRVEGGLPEADTLASATLDLARSRQRALTLQLRLGTLLAHLEEAVGEPVDLPERPLEEELALPLPEPVPSSPPPALRAAESTLLAVRAQRRLHLDWVQGELRFEPGESPRFGLQAQIPLPSFRYRDGEVEAAELEVKWLRASFEAERRARDARRDRLRRRYEEARTAVAQSRSLLEQSRASLESLLPTVLPHQAHGLRADLLNLERRHLRLVREALALRRQLERS